VLSSPPPRAPGKSCGKEWKTALCLTALHSPAWRQARAPGRRSAELLAGAGLWNAGVRVTDAPASGECGSTAPTHNFWSCPVKDSREFGVQQQEEGNIDKDPLFFSAGALYCGMGSFSV